jgi:hypothetical protein
VVLEAGIEPHVGDEDDIPGDEASDRCDVREPVEHLCTAVLDVEVGEGASECCKSGVSRMIFKQR